MSAVDWSNLRRSERPVAELLGELGEVFARFDARTQDSGNVSYGLRIGGARFFVKTAGAPGTAEPIDNEARVARLRNAVVLRRSVESALLPELHGVIECPAGPALVYGWVDGQSLYENGARRSDPGSAFRRFRGLPRGSIVAVLDATFALHARLARAGWVAADFYDGCFLYDFERATFHLVDLDHYRSGPFVNPVGRLPGSMRFMAPEELRRGARIDERTTVFNLGRAGFEFLAEGRVERAAFPGSDAQHAVLSRACAEHPANRFGSVSAFRDAWEAAGP